MCAECRATHARLRSLSNHVVISIEEFSRELGGGISTTDDHPLASSLPSSTASAEAMRCRTHSESLKFYCSTCHTLICKDCTGLEHARPRHRVESVDKLVHKHKSDLEGGVADVRVHLAEVRKLAAEKAILQQDVEREMKELCLVLDHVFQELQLNLEHRKRKLVKEIEKKAAAETERISQELTRYESKSSELDSLLLACSEALHYTTDQELMVLRRDLQTRLKEVTVIRKVNHSPPNPAEPPNLSLLMSCAGEIEAACKEIAHASLFVSHSKTRIEKVKSTMAEVGREVHIIVSALTKDGKPCLEPLELEAEVSIPRFELNLKTSVAPSLAAGTYQVTFTPTRRGEHLVLVRVGGREIESCPFPVPVRSSKLELNLPEKILPKKEWPWGVACGSVNRHVYVTENYNHCISVWDKNGTPVRIIGQKGQKPGQIIQPTGIAIASDDSIYVADGKDVGRVQKLSKMGQLLAIYVGLQEPRGVALGTTEDRVYVCDSSCIKVFDRDLNLVESFGELTCSLEQHQVMAMDDLQSPHSLAVDKDNSIYVTDTMGQHIHVYDKTGTHVRSIGHPHDDEFAPSGIAIEDEYMFVADRGGNQVVVFTTDGNFVMATGTYGTANGQFNNPSGVAVDIDGYLYVCDFGNSRIQVF